MNTAYTKEILTYASAFGCLAASKKYRLNYEQFLQFYTSQGLKKQMYAHISDLPKGCIEYIKIQCEDHHKFLNTIMNEANEKFSVHIVSLKNIVDEIFYSGYYDEYVSKGVKRNCQACGKEFWTTSSRRQFCYDDHYLNCCICGKRCLVPANKLSQISNFEQYCCSKQCSVKRGLKTKNRNAFDCVCSICGKHFKSVNKFSHICNDQHYGICAVCGKQFELNYPYTRKTCSENCREVLASKTTKSRYGVDNAFNLPDVRTKAKASVKAKYGADNYFQSDAGQQYLRTRWQDPKSAQLLKEHQKATFQKHYGYDWGLQVPDIKVKARQTLLDKYGVDNISRSRYFYSKINSEPTDEQIGNLILFKSDPIQFLDSLNYKPSLKDLSSLLGIRDSSVGYLIDQLEVPQDRIKYVYSYMEDEVFEFLQSLNLDIVIQRNTFKVITPYELDLYIPEYRLAIECNPTSTHNSSFGAWSVEDNPLPRDYHQMKTNLCEKQGIQLFHIFGYEWAHKRDIIKSMISNILHNTKHVIYARNTQIKPVTYIDSYKFLEENHRQGNTVNSIRLGLYYQNELVSLMTFGKMRQTIGIENTSGLTYELSRFCSKLAINVVGGASKLFAHFIKIYNPDTVISFSDRAHTLGHLYEILGFEQIRQSDPGYVWVRLNDDTAWSRVNAQKKNIKSFLKDNNIDLSKTEFEIMEEHKYAAVFDSGTITWKWSKR